MVTGSSMDEYGTKVATLVGSTRHLIVSVDEDMKLKWLARDCQVAPGSQSFDCDFFGGWIGRGPIRSEGGSEHMAAWGGNLLV